MSAKARSAASRRRWASHPAYERYWQHYHQAMTWMRSHQLAYWKALEAYYSALWYSAAEDLAHTSYAEDGDFPQHRSHHVEDCDSQRSSSPPRSAMRPRPQRKSQVSASSSSSSSSASASSVWVSSSSDSEGVECDVSNMEITQELRDYFAQTERHQEERKRQQLLDEKRLEDYVNADHDLYHNWSQRSAEPPDSRVWERRLEDMQRLYGDSANKIQAMEAAMQLTFDKHCDRKRPKYWPVIPLKF
ncbi:gem-associated protein 8 [Sorex araneus]|uniref:gem-associated protein 8 n=1 Tax=Sorex araneus TaxID=42254 RepID=UPI002433DA05|nr:gem-associated protein 8 [Sorex araneus]